MLLQTVLPFEDPAEPKPIVPLSIAYIRHPRAKRYVIRVCDDGSVRVTIPRWGSKREATAFCLSQHAWIVEQQRGLHEQARRRPPKPLDEVRRLRDRATRELPARLLELANRFGLKVRKISVRNQRRRWGSCSRTGHICLSWRLVDMPGWVRDYVLIHELMHLKRMDHSRSFWKLVAAACPDYERARRWLRQQAEGVSEG
jgi:predicted metal-dependent hydrolase